MTLRKTIEVVTKLAEKQVIGDYAIAGAVAALNYIQPALTEYPDILVSLDGFGKRTSGLLLLGPIESALTDMGYTERTDLGYKIEEWPVQFLPVSSPLDEEALEQAVSRLEPPQPVPRPSAPDVLANAFSAGIQTSVAPVAEW
jgi:hypothetical protein